MKNLKLVLIGILFSGSSMAQGVSTDFSGCEPDDFVTVESGAVIETRGSAYTPKCLKIVVGSTVSISASSRHPLQGVEGAIDAPINPIFDDLGASINDAEFTFDSVGEFGYYCVAHGTDSGAGMAGLILVIPESE